MCGRERDAVQETNNEEKYARHRYETRCQGARGSARDGTSRVRSRSAAFIGAECELSLSLDTSPDTIYHFRILRKCPKMVRILATFYRFNIRTCALVYV